jgi:SAM-dependent methyltransferase
VGQEDSDGTATTQDLIARLEALADRLQQDQSSSIPIDEPYLGSGSAVKGGVKRGVFRLTRPATRRYDRLATELTRVAVELAERLSRTDADVEGVRGDIDRLDHAVQAIRAAADAASLTPDEARSDGSARVPDDYYWAFEARMRGSSASVVDRLRQYERFAVPLRTTLSSEDAEPPLWLDLGCGLGEFCELVRGWGWRVEGVDSSPGAVEACRERGVEATLADATEYLATRRGEELSAVSAIQLIEHLPPQQWLPLLGHARSALRSGGALLLETINGLNPRAVAAYFIADITHTWPGHPETLSLMAEHVGFSRTEIAFMNPDERGNAQDFALWALA